MGIFRITWEVFRILVLKRIPFNRNTIPYYIAFVLNVITSLLIALGFIILFLPAGFMFGISTLLLTFFCCSLLLVLHHEVLKRACATPPARRFLYVLLYYRALCLLIQFSSNFSNLKEEWLLSVFYFDSALFALGNSLFLILLPDGTDPTNSPLGYMHEPLIFAAGTLAISFGFFALAWLGAALTNRIDKFRSNNS